MNWKEFDYKSPSLIGVKDESHGGEDVPILAKGPWAHLFTGIHFHMFGWGPIIYSTSFKEMCH